MATSWSLALPPSPVSSAGKSGDRYIPSRAGATWDLRFHSQREAPRPKQTSRGSGAADGKGGLLYSALLKNELLGAGIENVQELEADERSVRPSAPSRKNLFTYSPSTTHWSPDTASEVSPYALLPVSERSQNLLTSSRPVTRNIARRPFKTIEAPVLREDFYLNLLDWSRLNVITVGLGTRACLWSATTCQMTRLCDLSGDGDWVTSVGWSERGKFVAIGTQKGAVQIWDVAAEKRVSVLEGHKGRVGVLAWNADQISSGSRDRWVLQRDVRAKPQQSRRWLRGHKKEVCGLKWSPDRQLLASGGSDNMLLLWNPASLKPIQQYAKHEAAVKAIAWSPHQRGLLASGGGTADRCVRFWDTLTRQPLQSVNTGSQVCNLAWSRHSNELVSTHGYSENQIVVWRYPSLTQVAKLTGHSYRVLYLAVSPDGQVIVTGAGDQILRFWKVFPKSQSRASGSVLNLFDQIR
ncbi:fizzy-related protein homolog [Trichosurus vulpecula]|uniref:fizzy-related protein homolog n=1 Tax=Trichosurus vulpecula TaxID=9337 RepID=UPI00186AD16C|nr:fizzy-related protein homolog [Trichosurus vulpecula]